MVNPEAKNVYIYWKPKANAEKAMKLGKNTGVFTTGKKKNGYSQIRYSFTYAYVKTSALKSVAPNTKKKYAWNIASTNYKFKLYGDEKGNFKPKYYNTYKKDLSVKQFWLFSTTYSTLSTNEFDTSKGLYSGQAEDGIYALTVKYPVKNNSTWVADGRKYKILSNNSKVKTPAGTFNNVVKVHVGNSISYYAPNKGLIKSQTKFKNKYSTNFALTK